MSINFKAFFDAIIFGPKLPAVHRKKLREMKRRCYLYWPYCGKRHMARIARQVEHGQLKAENGLC